MKRALGVIAFLACSIASEAAEIRSNDLLGTWLGETYKRYNTHFTFRPDHTFSGVDGDEIYQGKWKLHRGAKLEFIYSANCERNISEFILIDAISKTRLRVAWLDNGKIFQRDIWTKEHR